MQTISNIHCDAVGKCDLVANPTDNFYAPILGFGKPYKTVIEEVEVGGYICGSS